MSTPFKRGFLQWMKAPHRCCALLSIRIVTIQYPLSHYERKLIRLLCSTIRNLFAKATLLAELTWRRPGWRRGHRSIRGSLCLTMVSLECRNVRCRIYLFTFHEQINVIIRKDKIVVTKHIVFHCEERKQAAVLALQATGRELIFFFCCIGWARAFGGSDDLTHSGSECDALLKRSIWELVLRLC